MKVNISHCCQAWLIFLPDSGKTVFRKELIILAKVALTLVIIGALNWLLVGLFQFDLVASLFGGANSWLSRAIYTVVGLAGIFSITMLFEDSRERT